MANNRRKSNGGFTNTYTLKKGKTPITHIAYLWQLKKISDDQLRQLAKGEEVDIRLTESQANDYPVVAYKTKNGKGGIFYDDDVQQMKEAGLATSDSFVRIAVWNDENEAVLSKDETEEFFDSISHVEKLLSGQAPAKPVQDAPAPASTKNLDTQVLEFLESLSADERNAWLAKVSAVVKTMNESPSTGNAMDDWLKAHAAKK